MTSKLMRGSFSASSNALQAIPYSLTPGQSKNFDLSISQNFSSSNLNDPPYLYNQLRSDEWLERYGLKSQKLTFDQILQQVGFKRVESFDPALGKTITAKYAGNLYHEVLHENGDRYVLTCRPEKLREYHQRLVILLNFLRKRLQFISSGSRRLFGVISEPSVCLICDCKTIDHRIFNRFQAALTSLFKEQISKIKRVHIIWVSNDNEEFSEKPTDVSSSNLDQIMDWISDRKCPKGAISISATSEAFKKAFIKDVHAIYLISEGESSDSSREILRDTIVKSRSELEKLIPVHVVSLYCHNNDTQVFLRSIAESGDGSFCCYKIKSELPDLRASSNLSDPTRIQIQSDRLQIGTNALTPIPEFPADINLMFKEINQCQTIIDRLENILGFIRDENQVSVPSFSSKSLDGFQVSGEQNFQRSVILQSSTLFGNEETEMTSADWLKTYGIDAQKLDFFSVLTSAAFRHCDGVVTVLRPPLDNEDTSESTPANPEEKLVNAKYCDQFAHVTWPDATIRHVHVTPELYRDYERRLRAVLEKIKARLSWLKKGSRDVFGTILENNIYFLIDTSKSMQHHLGFVKEKLRMLLKDQLITKEKVNFVAFNSSIIPWRDRLTRIHDSSTISQLEPWIDGLSADGTTNTLAAIRFALADSATEAIYLLSDGRPDQSERHILSQVQYRQTVPIHTIAFNCQDQTANQFLFDLSKQTGGRFHTFNYTFNQTTESIELPESEDVGLLKNEYLRGEQELARIAALRDECISRAWARDNLFHKTNKYIQRQTPENNVQLLIRNQDTFNRRIERTTETMSATNKRKKKGFNQQRPSRSASASILSTMNNGQRLLPETREYLRMKSTTRELVSDSEATPKTTKKEKVKTKEPKTPYDEVIRYLRKKSLVARGLTIFDVLHPTMVTVKDPKHIQVIDKEVLSRVWKDILPLAFGSYTGKLRLINHYAVNLAPYEENLDELIREYNSFVTRYIWKHLNDEERLKICQTRHWINLDESKKQEAKDEIPQTQLKSQDDLDSFAWRKLSADEQEEQCQMAEPYNGPFKDRLKKGLVNSENKSALEGVSRMDTEISRALKFKAIATDLRQLQKRHDEDNNVQPIKQLPKLNETRQRVICFYDVDGYFRPGTIERNINGRVVVHFDIGCEVLLDGQTIFPISGAIAQPRLYPNDYVLVRQAITNDEYWLPGVVAVLPDEKAPPPSLYTLQIYSPDAGITSVPRRYLVKISHSVFQKTVTYLQKIGPQKMRKTLENGKNEKMERIESIIRRKFIEISEQFKKVTTNVDTQHLSEIRTELRNQSEDIRDLQERKQKVFLAKKQTVMDTKSVESKSIQTGSITPPPSPPPPETGETGEAVVMLLSIDGFGHDCVLNGETLEEVRKHIKNNDLPATKQRSSKEDVGNKSSSVQSDGRSIKKDDQKTVKLKEFPSLNISVEKEHVFMKSSIKKLGEVDEKHFFLIRYPNDYRKCWSPAVALHKNGNYVSVRHYDCYDEDVLSEHEVIPISREQFQLFVTKRIRAEKLIAKPDSPVIGYCEEKNEFYIGNVLERIEYGRTFKVEWANYMTTEVKDCHLFGTFSIRPEITNGQHVLAFKSDTNTYCLATVIKVDESNENIKVRFFDTEKHATVQAMLTFPIPESYYTHMTKTLKRPFINSSRISFI